MMLEEEVWGPEQWTDIQLKQQYLGLAQIVKYLPRRATRGALNRWGRIVGLDLNRDLVQVEWSSGITNWVPVTWLLPSER